MKTTRTIVIFLLFYATLSCNEEVDPIVNPPVVVNQPPLAPSNPTPAHGASITANTGVLLQWECSDPDGDEITYDVFLSQTAGDFGLEASDLSKPQLELDSLAMAQDFYWKVRATDTGGLSAESTIFSFTIEEHVFDGSIIINNQEELKLFGEQHYNRITGDLELDGSQSEIESLWPLISLIQVDGRLVINETLLTDLRGMNSLQAVGGSVILNNNNSLLSLSGISNITEIGGSLGIYSNDSLTELGPRRLAEIKQDLRIWRNHSLLNLTGLESVEIVGSSLIIEENESLITLEGVDGLKSIGQDLKVEENESLISLNGLDNLNFVGEFIYIFLNESLTSLDGLQGLEKILDMQIDANVNLQSLLGLNNLVKVEGNLSLINNLNLRKIGSLSKLEEVTGGLGLYFNPPLTSLNGLEALTRVGTLIIDGHEELVDLAPLQKLTTVTTGIEVTDNEILLTLKGLEGLQDVGEYVSIENNRNLTDLCALVNLVSEGFGGELTIDDNLFNPTAEDIKNNRCKQ